MDFFPPIKSHSFISKTKFERESERDLPSTGSISQKASTARAGTGQSQEALTVSSRSFMGAAEAQISGPFSTAFSRWLAGSWNWTRMTRTWTHAHMGWYNCRWRFNPLRTTILALENGIQIQCIFSMNYLFEEPLKEKWQKNKSKKKLFISCAQFSTRVIILNL